MGQYIGARYVPKFMGVYDPTQIYEALDVVDNGLGTSYISKIPTPAGTPLTNTTYWAIYGTSSGAIVNLQNQINDMQDGTVPGSLQNQINDNTSDISALENNVTIIDKAVTSKPINVLTLGVKNDGTEDISTIVNAATLTASLYFPAGTYRVEHPLMLANDIHGPSYNRQSPTRNSTAVFESYINASQLHTSGVIMINDTSAQSSLTITNIFVKGHDGLEDGIRLVNVSQTRTFYIEGVNIFDIRGDAIYIKGASGNSRCAEIAEVSIWGSNPDIYSTARGIVLDEHTYDSFLHDISVIGVGHSLILRAGLYFGTNIHLFPRKMNQQPTVSEFATHAIGIELDYGSRFYGTNVYLDTCFVGIVASAGAAATIHNIMANYDGVPSDLSNRIVFAGGDGAANCIFYGGMIYGHPRTELLYQYNYHDVQYALADTSVTNAAKMLSKYEGLCYRSQSNSDLGGFRRIAIIYFEYNGQCVLDCYTALDRSARVVFSRFGSEATFKKILNTSSCPLYYKAVSDRIYEIYIDTINSYYDVGCYVNMCSNGIHVIDLMNMRTGSNARIPDVIQRDDTGLTAIST